MTDRLGTNGDSIEHVHSLAVTHRTASNYQSPFIMPEYFREALAESQVKSTEVIQGQNSSVVHFHKNVQIPRHAEERGFANAIKI